MLSNIGTEPKYVVIGTIEVLDAAGFPFSYYVAFRNVQKWITMPFFCIIKKNGSISSLYGLDEALDDCVECKNLIIDKNTLQKYETV